jgi:hypothetical protein
MYHGIPFTKQEPWRRGKTLTQGRFIVEADKLGVKKA